MKVTLLKKVGDHPEGKELDITDETVVEAWKKLGVIAADNQSANPYAEMKVDELKSLAEEKELPKEEWEKLKKDELVQYLTEKTK